MVLLIWLTCRDGYMKYLALLLAVVALASSVLFGSLLWALLMEWKWSILYLEWLMEWSWAIGLTFSASIGVLVVWAELDSNSEG